MPTINKNTKKKLLTERLQYFKDEVDPGKVVPLLTCLTVEDRQEIECQQNNHGKIRALMLLIDRLRRRDKGFDQFVVALRKQKLDHVAQLLDPHELVEESEAVNASDTDNEQFRILGTAVDVEVNCQIRCAASDGNRRHMEFEELIAREYQSSQDENSGNVRKIIKKLMPRGIEFVRTKPNEERHEIAEKEKTVHGNDEQKNEEVDSGEPITASGIKGEPITVSDINGEPITASGINGEPIIVSDINGEPTTASDINGDPITASDIESDATADDEDLDKWKTSFKMVFRLTSENVAKQFWELYENHVLREKLRDFFIRETLRRLKKLNDDDDNLEFDLKIFEKDFQKIVDFFKNIESEQDVERTGESLLMSKGTGCELEEIDIKIPEVLLESHRSSVQQRNLRLREYQKELAASALQGKNAIICAPTNSGKTFVAMEIARTHLQKNAEEGASPNSRNALTNKPKVVFIVSTQNLVSQQRTRFEEHLTKYTVSDISGSNSTEIPLDFLLKHHDIVVLTAQILLNALQKNTVKIYDISLLIFDECHHTNKDHTYNKIMQNYMTMKYQATKDYKLPQIVGLTASLGVGKSSESEKAKNHILQICANMDAFCINTVQENLGELEQNVTGGVPRRRLEKVDQVANVFEKVIIQVMGKIETAAQKQSKSFTPPPADRIGQQYRQWVEGLENDAIGRAIRDLVTYAKHLRRYHISLLINDTVRIKDAMMYLEEFFDHLDTEKFDYTDEKLQELYKKARDGIQSRIETTEPQNPKLEKLKELILKFHQEDNTGGSNGEAKGILFTRTRDSTMGLKGWIQETQELRAILRPKVLVGAGDGEVGMTQGEQEGIIEEFKKGEVNILIATTVAEEGLDIGDCNFVIRYNMAGNEISSVQSRGRIRADEGNYVYVGDSRTKGVNREQLNQYREILMNFAVQEVQRIPQEQYMKKIKEIQQNDVRKIQMKNSISKKTKTREQEDGIIFKCKSCNATACNLGHFRRMKDNYHVILDRGFKEKIQVKPKKKSKKIDDVIMDSQVHCKACGEEWGVSVKIDGLVLPCLKLRSFAIEQEGQTRLRIFKKWSDFPYEIPEATLAELIAIDVDVLEDDLDFNV